MKNYKQIDKCDVWSHLQAGKKVYVVIFESRKFATGLAYLWKSWNVTKINNLLKEENAVFYEKKEDEKDD